MILSDIERKILTIIKNTRRLTGHFPTVKELCTKTGKTEKGC